MSLARIWQPAGVVLSLWLATATFAAGSASCVEGARAFAAEMVDRHGFDGDGRRDLAGSPADAIGSVANYFARHGWEAGAPIAFRVELNGRPPLGVRILDKKPEEPSSPAGALSAAGIPVPESVLPSSPVNLIRLEAPEDEFWLGLENFYVITRYNHSNLYAVAVFQLSGEIRDSYVAEE